MQDFEILAVAKVYTNNTVIGMGALKGAPCTVQGVVDNGDGTQTLTLKWTDTTGTDHTTDITLPSDIFEVTSPTNGQTLRYNSTSGKFENSNVSFSADLGDLDDVVLTSVQDGQVLTYDAVNNRWINADGSTVAALSDLTDVTISTVQNGQILSYDSATSKWINITLADVATSGEASDISYDNTTSGLTATDAQAAIDEIVLDISQLSASKVSFDGTASGLSANKVQGAIDELADEKVDKETGKGLSANDFTNALKTKLDGIEAEADVNVIEQVKVNGTALTPDANKAVNIEEKVSKLSDVDLTGLDDNYILIYDEASEKWIVGPNTGATYTAGEGIEIDQNNKISSKFVLYSGTEAGWNALSLADKIKFTHYATNDDQTGQIDPVPTQNSNNLMTSGGIYTALQGKANTSDLGTAAAKDSTNAVTQSSTDLVESGAVYTALDAKADKVTGATANNFAGLDSNGNLQDSGKKAADFATPTDIDDIYKANSILGAKNLNKFPYKNGGAGDEWVTNGITYTVNADGSITANGTATADAYFRCGISTDNSNPITLYSGQKYILNGTGQERISVRLRNSNNSGVANATTDPTVYECNATGSYYVLLEVPNGETVDNLRIYPMLRFAQDDDAAYQPYAKTNKELTDDVSLLKKAYTNNLNQNGCKNICIGGRDYLETNNTTFIKNADGSYTANCSTSTHSTSICEVGYITEFKIGETYHVNGCPSGGGENTYDIFCVCRDSEGTATRTCVDYGSGANITVPSNTAYIQVYYRIKTNVTVTNLVAYPMFCLLSDWNISQDFQKATKTNRQLTDDSVDWDSNSILGAHNLYNMTNISRTNAGITFTVNEDKTITVSGTATADTYLFNLTNDTFAQYKTTLPKGTYIVSGGIANSNVYFAVLSDVTGSIERVVTVSSTAEKTFTLNTDANVVIQAYVTNGQDVTTPVTLKPMIRLASDKNSDYQPSAMTNKDLTDLQLKYVEINISGTTISTAESTNYYAVVYPDIPANAKALFVTWGGSGGWQSNVRFEINSKNNAIILISSASITIAAQNRIIRVYYI